MLRVLIATLAGTVVYFLVGWLVFERSLGKYMAGNTTTIQGFKKTGEETSMPMLLVSCAAYALLLSIVFEYWANVRTLNAGRCAWGDHGHSDSDHDKLLLVFLHQLLQ